MAGDYRDLIAWKKAIALAMAIYRLTQQFPLEERYGITAQLRRAGVSVPSNIAEGQGRNSMGAFLHHLSMALGSVKEIETQLLISDGLGYFEAKQAAGLLCMTTEVGRLINGLSKSIRNKQSLSRPANH